MRLRLNSIKGRFFIVLSVVVIPLIGFHYMAVREYSESQRALARHTRAATARVIAATIDDCIHHAVTELNIAKTQLELNAKHSSDNDISSILVNTASHIHGCIGMGFVRGDGRCIQYPQRAKATSSGFPVLSPKLTTSVSEVFDLDGQKVFVVGVPVKLDADHLAELYTVASVDVLAEHVAAVAGRSTGVIVLDRSGKPVYTTGTTPVEREEHSRSLMDIIGLPGTGDSSAKRVESSRATSGQTGWSVAVSDSARLSREIPARRKWLIGSMIAILASYAFAHVVARRIRSRMKRLTRATEAVAVGDLRRRVNIKSPAELAVLADHFNEMVESFERKESDLRFQTAVQQCLLDMSRQVTSSLDMEDVVTAICEALTDQFEAKRTTIFRGNETTGQMHAIVPKGSPGDDIPSYMVSLARHALTFSGESGQACVACPGKDYQDDVVVAVPLVMKRRRIGVLSAVFSVRNGSAKELRNKMRILESFAVYAAVAVHNAESVGRREEFIHALASLRLVIEAISSSLDLQQVLQALVRTTCEVMDAKACAILLADRDGLMSVAESHNLSRELALRKTVAPGQKWAGVAFEEKRFISRLDVAAEKDLYLRTHYQKEDLHGYMCAPLTVGEDVIGTICVWMAAPYEPSPAETYLLTSIAGHAAGVIANAKLFSREYHIAHTLQSTLMGSVPNKMGRLVFGHKYIPALAEAEVGGDLYDVVKLPNGKVGVFVADVAGKGIEAAIHIAAIRYMARAFAHMFPDSPSMVCEKLNKSLVDYYDYGIVVTAFYAVIDADTGKVMYANAGHPPAILLTMGGRQQIMMYRTGMPLGCSEDSQYSDRVLHIQEDDVIIIYTDGIIEARKDGNMMSTEGLQDIVFDAARLDPDGMVEAICDGARSFSGGEIRDDIALVAVSLKDEQYEMRN